MAKKENDFEKMLWVFLFKQSVLYWFFITICCSKYQFWNGNSILELNIDTLRLINELNHHYDILKVFKLIIVPQTKIS